MSHTCLTKYNINVFYLNTVIDTNMLIIKMNHILLKKSMNIIIESPIIETQLLAARKLMALKREPGIEFCRLFLYCCCEQRSYKDSYGYIAQVIINHFIY